MPATDLLEPTLELTLELMKRASVTPNDAGCQRILMDRLISVGFATEAMPFADVENFWATKGTTGPLLVFAGHTDVVPPGDEKAWYSQPFAPTRKDGYLVGRGAADMKASLAAMIVAVEKFVSKQPDHNGRIGFLITSDEEGPAKSGTIKVVESLERKGESIDWCIVGEPSSRSQLGDTIKNGRRGSINGSIIFKGKQGHIAYPHLASNPIHSAIPALQALVQEKWDPGNQFFDPTSLQISNIRAGDGTTNLIPGNVEVLFNLRFSSEISAEEIKKRCESILNKYDVDFTLSWVLSGEPFLTEPGALLSAVQDSILSVTGFNPEVSTGGGTSDGRFIAPTGAQVVEIGHVNKTIHQCNERVKLTDIALLTMIYERIIECLLT